MTPGRKLTDLSSEEKDALIVELMALVEAQGERIAALEAQRSGGKPPKTPDNSSLPPSRGQKRNRPPRPKRARKKRPGPGVTRALAEVPDRVVACYAEHCRHCGVGLGQEGQRLRQAYDHVELPEIRAEVTRVEIYGRRCPACRRRQRGAAPDALAPGSPFGLSVVRRLAYLHHHHAVSYQRLSALMAELFGLTISEGAIANALRRCGRPLGEATAQIRERLRQAQVIGCDETGARLTTQALGSRMAWEWVLVSAQAVLHCIHLSRGRAAIEEVLGEHRPRCWVSDRWSAQQGHAASQQVCLAHVLRDVQYALDCGEGAFASRLRDLLLWAIAIGRRRQNLKDSSLASYRAKAERRLDGLLALPCRTAAGERLKQQTRRWRHQFFTFLVDRDVPATNNASEQALRPSVIHRKVTNGFRSTWGADVHAAFRSVVGTGRLHSLSPYQAIDRALARQPILPA